MPEIAWGFRDTAKAGVLLGGAGAASLGAEAGYQRLNPGEQPEEQKPQGMARRVSPAEARRIQNNIRKQRRTK